MTGSSSTQVTLEQAIEIGITHLQNNNFVAADRTFRDILETVPDHYDSLHYLGLTCYFRSNLPEAIKFLQKAVAVDDSDPEAWNNLAIFLSDSKRYDEALEAWDKSIALKPDFPDPYSNKANTLWILERYEDAEALCRKALELRPEYPDAFLNLGNALVKQDKLEEAVEYWQKAVALVPTFSKAWNNLGNAMRDLGKLKESEEYCRKSLELDPKNPQAHSNLGNVLRDLGRATEAETCYRQAVALKPDYAEAHNNLAVVLIDMGRLDEAVVSARYSTSFKPDYAAAYSNMSTALRELGEFDEAEVAAQKAVNLNPEDATALSDLAEVLFLSDRYDEAEAALKEAERYSPDSPHIHLRMATVLERISRTDEALEHIEKAKELSPEMPSVYQHEASILFATNHAEDALKSIEKVLEIQPRSTSAMALRSEIYQSLGDMDKSLKVASEALALRKSPGLYFAISKVKKFTADDPDFLDMKEMAKHIGSAGLSQKSALHYALYKAYRDTGDEKKAFEALKTANDTKRKMVPYNREGNKTLHHRMAERFTPQFLKSFEGKGCKSDIPVFILGMPRSGTTLTEQIISSHPDVYGAGELSELSMTDQMFKGQPLSPEIAKKKGQAYIDMIKKLDPTGKAKHITDKMPGNYNRIGEIVSILPNAKIIHCRRNPIDNCLSCYQQSFARGQYWSYDLEELGEQYKLYDELMEHWRTVLPGRFLEVQYEDTVNNLEEQARKMIDYIGLEWNDACLEPHKQKRAVMTASKTQVIQPVYKTSVEKWRKYEKQLQPLVEILQPEDALKNRKKKKTAAKKAAAPKKKTATKKATASKKTTKGKKKS